MTTWNFSGRSHSYSASRRDSRSLHISQTNTFDDFNTLVYFPANSSQEYTTEHEYNFYRALLNRSIIRPHCPKICPECLLQFGYCRRLWDCSLVTACPLHECLLLDSCPKCRRRIKSVRKNLSICSCGCDWREIDPQFLSVRELAVSRRIYQLCDLLPKTPKEENENPLQSLCLRDFVVVLTFISGMFRNIAWATGRPSKSINLRNKDLHQLYSQAYSVFENWPGNFHQFVNKQSRGQVRLSPADGKLSTALKKEFGSLYEHLFQDLDGAQFDFMRESFAELLTARLKSQCQGSGENPWQASLSEIDKCISMAQARRLLKISHRDMFDLITSGEVGFVIRNRGTTLECVLPLSDVENLKRKFEQSLSTRDLARELGVDCEAVRELARAGHLRTRWRPAVDGYHTIKFDRDSTQELLNSGVDPYAH